MRTTAKNHLLLQVSVAAVIAGFAGSADAALVYLNKNNISVALGASHAGDTDVFVNRTNAESLANVIDAPSETSTELHNQTTHVWVNDGNSSSPGTNGALELDFDLGFEYDLKAMYFWNYHSENYDVDQIVFKFYDAASVFVGQLSASPKLGNQDGSDGTPITPEEYLLAFPTNVRYVNALLTGTNQEVDFNNIGFTAELSAPSPVPLPAALPLMVLGLSALGVLGRRRAG